MALLKDLRGASDKIFSKCFKLRADRVIVETFVLGSAMVASVGIGYVINKAALGLLLRAMGLNKR